MPKACIPSVLSGHVKDLLDNCEDTETTKILNGLDFPLWNGKHDLNPYATDLAAWDVTRGLHCFDPGLRYPTCDVQWGLAGHKYSMTFNHIEPDGFLTKITVGLGGKAWGILRERPGVKKSSIRFYLDKHFSLNEVDNPKYDFEIMALKTGDCLYVLPLLVIRSTQFDSCCFKIYATGRHSFRIRNGKLHLLRQPFLFDPYDATDPLIAHPFFRS